MLNLFFTMQQVKEKMRIQNRLYFLFSIYMSVERSRHKRPFAGTGTLGPTVRAQTRAVGVRGTTILYYFFFSLPSRPLARISQYSIP